MLKKQLVCILLLPVNAVYVTERITGKNTPETDAINYILIKGNSC